MQNELLQLDLDSLLSGVFLISHHPPFSNSQSVGDHEPSKMAFHRAFVSSRKTLAWLSGHAHGYEHFEESGKHFFVSAGGGGPRQAPNPQFPHKDLFQGSYPRPFNYLILTKQGSELNLQAQGWDAANTRTNTMDSQEFELR